MAAAFDPASLRRSVTRAAACGAFAAALCLGALGCGPQVQIVLLRGEDLQGRPEFVRFEVADLTTDELERFGPYSTDGLPGDELARVPPGNTFVIYVIGCKTAEIGSCENTDDMLAIGCSAEQTLARGEEATIEITLHTVAVGLEDCDLPEITP